MVRLIVDDNRSVFVQNKNDETQRVGRLCYTDGEFWFSPAMTAIDGIIGVAGFDQEAASAIADLLKEANSKPSDEEIDYLFNQIGKNI
jgi:hypothetical protein